MSTYAGHYTDAPRDSFGRPIPSTRFQLYTPGTKVAPTLYTDRLKSDTVAFAESDYAGNVDIYVEPGIYEYWYDDRYIQTITVDEDNEEDDHALATAVAAIQVQLADISVGAAYAPGGTSDDTTALQTYIDELPSGAECLFAPGRQYTISSMIKFRANLSYRCAGNSHGESAAVIHQKDGSNITSGGANPFSGLFVPVEWYNNETTCAFPTRFEGIKFDTNKTGNPTTTAAGLVTMNFWTWVKSCFFTGADDLAYGLVLADKTRNNVTITNSISEPHLYENRFDGCRGLYVQCTGDQANLDGILVDNKFTAIYGDAITLDKAAGWIVQNNHFYGGGGFATAISAHGCFATLIADNYIEDFGGLGESGQYYGGIAATILDGWGTRILGNQIASPEIAGCTSTYIDVIAGADQTDAHVVVANNVCNGNGGENAIGIVYENAAGGVLNYASSNNITPGFLSNKHTFIDDACVVETTY